MRRLLEFLLRLRSGELEGADSLVPTFAADYHNWIILGLAALFFALVALTVMCYLREGASPRRVKLTLAGIRIAVILLLLLLLFQPGLVLRYKEDLYSTVVVMIDDSQSQSLKDRYADPQLRQALKQKLSVDDETLWQMSRSEMVRRVLTRRGGPLAKLARNHELAVMRFATSDPAGGAYTQSILKLAAAKDDQHGQDLADQIARVLDEKLTAGGYETNLAAALREPAYQLQGWRVAAIVIVSDGQMTTGAAEGGNRLASAVAYVRQRNIPIYAVVAGDPQPPQNLTVLRLQGPSEVRKGSDVELTAYLAHRNCGGQIADLGLFRRLRGAKQWEATDVTRNVKLALPAEPGQSHTQEVTLRHQADRLGEFEYLVRAKPLEQEFSASDNEAAAQVRVCDEQLKVLLVSGDAGWEFQYLRNFLLGSPQRYAVSVWQQDAEKEFNQDASTGMRLTQLPRTKIQLYEYEVVILYDPMFTGGGFDGEFAKILGSFVSDHRGGLCYIASNKFTDRNLTGGAEFEPLINLLPVRPERRSGIEDITRGEPVAQPMVVTAAGIDHPVLRLEDESKDNANLWALLPGVYWSQPVRRIKPGATSLADSSAQRMTDSAGGPAPLIAVQYYGKGRCLYIGSDETWRWRALSDGAYYRRFWSNAVDFLASGRLQKKRVIITTGGDRFAVGQEMRIRAEAYDEDYNPKQDKTFQVDIINRATGKSRPVTLQLDPGQKDAAKKAKGHYEAKITLKEIGTFELTALRGESDHDQAVAGKTITVTIPQEEFVHPEADPDTMRTIAGEGAFLQLHEADRLAELIPTGKRTIYNDVPRDLWDVPLTLIVLVLLLGVEWILRKKNNMA